MSKTRHKAHNRAAAEQLVAMLESKVVALQKHNQELQKKIRELEAPK